jgi:biotin transporter BioY
VIPFLNQNPNDSQVIHHFTKTYRYIPQIPAVFFIVALLGRKFGIIAILGYITLGMFFPIFALGGGITYLFEYGFGYILAYIPAIFLTGTLLKIKTDFLRIVLMGLVGVLSIHLLGVLYMLFISTLRHAPMELVWGWISSQSGVQIFYDVFFTVLGIYLGRWTRRLLWIVMC